MTNDRIRALLDILADGEGHSGEAIGERLGVSRAAVWKLVDQARHAGLEVLAAPGAGYHLRAPMTPLDSGRIAEVLGDHAKRYERVEVCLATGSTNEDLLGLARSLQRPVALLAEHQSAGRGRRGRAWHSPLGASLYLSVAWPLRLPVAGLSGLSLAAGIALADALDASFGTRTGLKWPNDLYLGGHKLGGILVEVTGSPEGPCVAVIGIGLNCRLPEEGNEAISQPWTDLHRATGGDVDRNHLAAALLISLSQELPRFEQQGFAPFVERWNARDILRDQPVTLLLGEETAEGVARGVGDLGALLLEQEGQVRSIAAGDVSLRPATQ